MDTLLYKGSDIEIKHLGGTLYELKGALVLFGNPQESDFVKDFFVNDADYDLKEDGTGESTVYFNHGMDEVIGKAKLGKGKAQLTKDDKAVWIKHQLDQAEAYDAMVIELLQKRKATGKSFGWSSGTTGHLVEREAVGSAMKIKRWPLGSDASITLIPNDWRQTLLDVNALQPSNIKSLIEESDSEGEQEAQSEAQLSPEADNTAGSATQADDKPTADVKTPIQIVGERMAEENQQAPAPQTPMDAEFMKRFNAMETRMGKLMDVVENSPRLARNGYYTSDGGAADPNIKSVGDLLMAVKRNDAKRLETIYNVKAQTESSGAAGGWLVPQQTLTNLDMPLELKSGIGNLVRRIPVSSPAGEAPIRDYSRVPTASAGNSASAQGIESQKRAEGGSYGAESIYFEMLQWRVTDFASGTLKASREIMEDAPMIESMLREAIQEDVANKEEYGILRGNGVGQPLGVLNWAGTATVTEATDNTFAVADMDNMVAKLLRGNGSRVAWVYHNYVYSQIAKLERGTGGAVMHNIKDALPTFLSGYPQFMSQHLPALGTSGYNILGDWSKYFLFELGGLYVNFSEHRYADEGNVAWFFGKRIDGKPAMTSALTLADGTSTLSPFVKILNLS